MQTESFTRRGCAAKIEVGQGDIASDVTRSLEPDSILYISRGARVVCAR
jgi:hypothetical protein